VSYFAYTGKTPLNVFTFFAVFLLPQLFLIVLFFCRAALARLIGPRPHLHKVLLPLFSRFVYFLKKRTIGNLRPEQQQSLSGLFVDHKSRLFSWPLFVHCQLFGIAFNIGLLTITLFKIATTDLAFGWQTTLELGAESLFGLVQFLALPWSWFLPTELSYPTLAQIEGSRIILKEGIYHLLTEDLTSWWPFLLMSLACYGLLPRMLLLLFGLFMERRHINRFLGQRKFQTISSRMRTPLVTSQAAPQSPPQEHMAREHRQTAGNLGRERAQLKNAVVLIPDEIFASFDIGVLERLLLPYGYFPVGRKSIFKDYDSDQVLLTEIAAGKNPVIVFFEAWMAPIREHLLFLEKLSRRLAGTTPLAVCLLGKPDRNGVLTPPRPREVLLWKEKISECCDVAVIFEAKELTDESNGMEAQRP
jgi:hypothetical protein